MQLGSGRRNGEPRVGIDQAQKLHLRCGQAGVGAVLPCDVATVTPDDGD